MLAQFDHGTVWRTRFDLSGDRSSEYRWNGETYAVAGDLRGDLRIAYVSCNGEEAGDLEREGSERNPMWARLGKAHRQAPFSLLLHGGDQVYADEVTQDHGLRESAPASTPERRRSRSRTRGRAYPPKRWSGCSFHSVGLKGHAAATPAASASGWRSR